MTRKRTVYFEVFGKKLKIKVESISDSDAKDQVTQMSQQIKFLNIETQPSRFDFVSAMLGIFDVKE